MRPAPRAAAPLPAAPPPAAPHGRAAAALVLALAILLLSACTAGHPGTSPGSSPAAGHRSLGPRGRALGQARRHAIGPGGHGGVFILRGGPGGPGGVIAIGPGGFGGSFIALPGAGPAGSTGRPKISVPPVPPAGSAGTVPLPLDSYEQVSVQQQDALAAASDLLTQRCMLAAGFSYTEAAEPGGGAVAVQSIEYSGYGLTSLTQALSLGYKQPASGSGPAGPAGLALPAFVGQQNKHGTAWTSALLGFVPGARAGAPQREGCLQAAYLELYGTLSGNPNPDPVPAITVQSAQWTQSDPRVLAVQRAWSACMARRGLSYKSPAQAEGRNWPSTPTPTEIETAVADVQCKAQVNLVNTWLTVEAAYQQALISQNASSLAQLRANFGALQRRAETALELPSGAGILRISRERPGRGTRR
jgi:hypothetical protein